MAKRKKIWESLYQEIEQVTSTSQSAFKAAAGKPVLEILDAEKKPTKRLKIATMEESFVEAQNIQGTSGPNPGKATFNPDKDDNKFFVRLKDVSESGEKQIDVKLSTQNPNPKYDEKDRTVVLKEKENGSGVFESDALLLTSDTIDDTVVVNKIEDNQCDEKKLQCDQTFQTMLDGKIQVDYFKNDVVEASAKAKVPVVKELNVSVNILKKEGQEVISREEVERQIEETNEIYAPAGIKINAHIVSVDVPEGVDLSNGFSKEDEKALFDKLATPSLRDVQIFYVGEFDKRPGHSPAGSIDGIAYTRPAKNEAILNDKSQDNFLNNVVVSNTKVPYALSHEIGHLLRGNKMPDTKTPNILVDEIGRLSEGVIEKKINDHADSKTQYDLNYHYPYDIEEHPIPSKDPKAVRNVMADGNINGEYDPASNSKRWTFKQIEKMHESPLLKDPESKKQSLEEKEEEEKEKKPRLVMR